MGNNLTEDVSKPQTNRQAYSSWTNMKTRCYNRNTPRYARYGGRGIKVCDRWLTFDNFYEDMGNRPKGMSIERIDNDGDYELSNCRWANPVEQASNRRSNVFITINDETATLKQWAIKQELKYKTVWQRINGYGWSVERALGI